MPEKLTSHKVNGLNEELDITVCDEPGQGNACHEYEIADSKRTRFLCEISFQNGPIKEFGVNGISNEALLAIVEHRLLGFQSGEFSSRDNAVALTKLQECMMWLHKRTRDRVQRGVEGTNVK